MEQVQIGAKNHLRHWQMRIFTTVWVTYFAYYLCRYNMPVAKTRLCETFSWDASQIGIVFTALTVMYAIGQFVNGQLADRFGTRFIAALGVIGSVLMNIAVFLTVIFCQGKFADPKRILILVATFWGINGFFQAMGWSPMVRVMAHWFPAESRGKIMGVLGTCYQFGGAFANLLAFFLVGYYVQKFGGDWRTVFLVPAVIFAVVGVFFFVMIRNYPEDVGLPPVETAEQDHPTITRHTSLIHNVMRTLENPYLWVVAATFFMLDVNRYGFVNWLPAFVAERGSGSWMKDMMKLCIHPLAGSAGAVFAGWATDKFFKGRRAPVIAILLVILGISSIIFPHLDPKNSALIIFVIALVGFCTYGPHILMVGHAAQDFGKRSGAAGAAGFIDSMGYIGASLAGWGAGVFIMKYGYNFTFAFFGATAIVGALLVCIIWKAGPKTHTVEE
jgi:sugar phosphate permease